MRPLKAISTQNLRELQVEISQDNSCFGYYNQVGLDEDDKMVMNSKRICAKSNLIEGACDGDSGSPLMKIDVNSGKIEVIGITHGGFKEYCILQTFFTRIQENIPWINQNLKEFDNQNVIHLRYFSYLY